MGVNISPLVGWVIWVDEGVGSGTIGTVWDTLDLLRVGVSRSIVGGVGVVLEVGVSWVIRIDEGVPVRVGSLSRLDIVVSLDIVVVVVSRGSLLNRCRCRLTIVRIVNS